MKNSMTRFLPVLAALLMMVFFAACEKDEINEAPTTPITQPTTTVSASPVATRLATRGAQAQSSSSTDGLQIGCISIDYPFDFDVDGVVYTINSIDDLDTMFSTAVTQNTVSLDFVYPIDVTLEDGTAGVAADGGELSLLVSACIPGSGWGNGAFPAFYFDDPNCVSISYPVTLLDEDGASVTALDATELVSLLAANPFHTYNFPINVVDTAGTVTSVLDEEALFDLLAQCACPGNGGGHGGGNGGGNGGGHGVGSGDLSFLLGDSCFTHNYPLDVLDIDGNTVSLADESAFSVLLLNGMFVDFVYPFTVTLVPDGSQITVNNGMNFYNAFATCAGGGTFDYSVPAGYFFTLGIEDTTCYSVVYPLTVTDVYGADLTVTSETEARAYIAGSVYGTIKFPVDVVNTSTGSTITLADDFAFFNLLGNCM